MRKSTKPAKVSDVLVKTVEKYIDRPIVQAKMAAGKSFEEIVDEEIPDMKFMSYVYEASNA